MKEKKCQLLSKSLKKHGDDICFCMNEKKFVVDKGANQENFRIFFQAQ